MICSDCNGSKVYKPFMGPEEPCAKCNGLGHIPDGSVTAHSGHIIDCDVEPVCNYGWTIEEHRKDGQLLWDSTKVNLFLSKDQKAGIWVKGYNIRQELGSQPALNVNVLDYLMVHQALIPKHWESIKHIFFWGTIYRFDSGDTAVHYLYFQDGKWDKHFHWLHIKCSPDEVALVRI